MMLSRSARVLAFLALWPILGAATAAASFEESYDCSELGTSAIGWDNRSKKYTADAFGPPKRPGIVKLSNLNGPTPYLTGQQVTQLLRVSEGVGVAWFIERAPAGTIIGWTLIDRQGPLSPPHVALVSTKAYDFLGPQTFTTIYECLPNSPARR
jgi:hypothetical protein